MFFSFGSNFNVPPNLGGYPGQDGGDAGGGGIFGGGTTTGTNSGGGNVANIIGAIGNAVANAAGAITGHQAQYNQQQYYQPLPQNYNYNQGGGNSLSLDRGLSGITSFVSQNILLVALGIGAILLFKRDPNRR